MPGVYQLANEEKRIVYIGQSATDVPNRIRQHLSRPGCVRENAHYWRYEYSRVPRAREAELISAYGKSSGGQLPPCNRATPLERSPEERAKELFSAP